MTEAWNIRATLLRSGRWTIPLFLVLAGVVMLVGCVYFPSPEHRVDPNEKDFRELIGSADRPGLIHTGMTRTDLALLLGKPTYASSDGRTAVYFVDLMSGEWVGICAPPSRRKAVGLVLQFNEYESLQTFSIHEVDEIYDITGHPIQPARLRFLYDNAHDLWDRASTQPFTQRQ